jgi:hypothetical protein
MSRPRGETGRRIHTRTPSGAKVAYGVDEPGQELASARDAAAAGRFDQSTIARLTMTSMSWR